MVGSISLLTPEYYARKNKERKLKLVVTVVGAALIGLLIFYSVVGIKVREKQKELRAIELQIEDAQEQTKELEPYQALEQNLALYEKNLAEAVGCNPNLIDVVKEVGKTVPQELALTKIECIYDYPKERDKEDNLLPGQAYMNVKGTLYSSPQLLSIWSSTLKGLPSIEWVECTYAPHGNDYKSRLYDVSAQLIIRLPDLEEEEK